ncbi:MAG: serine/threonine-protein kinase [Acidobacteriota bacterium]
MRSRIGPYEVIGHLGAGGMGEVYRARDPRLGREVAIKVLPAESLQDRDRLRRFVAEAKAASALNHPNILTVHDIGEDENGPYMVTELVEGRTLRALMQDDDGPVPLERVLDVMAQALDGIAKAHEAGIVHRDLKPENLMVTSDGFVKVLDFGLAKLLRREETGPGDQSATATGVIVGTAGYLAPEQLRGSPPDNRSDLFAAAVVFYEAATGTHPFRRDSTADTFSAVLRDDPVPLSRVLPASPADLSSLIGRALAKKPEDRPGSAREMAGRLRDVRRQLESKDRPTHAFEPPPRPRRFHWPLVAGAALAAILAAAVVSRRQAPPGAAVRMPEGQLAVAVLPIQDASGDPALARAGVGRVLGDALSQIVSDIPKVYVVSPIRLADTFRAGGLTLAGASGDSSAAARLSARAGANAMLSGRLSRVGSTYVLDAELTRLPDTLVAHFQSVAESADRLLPELTGGISRRIREKLGAPGTSAGVDRVATSSLDAYTHFLRGRESTVEGDWKSAIPELEKALEADPQMALAWSELSCAYSFAGDDAKSRAAQKKAEEFQDRVNRKERFWIEQSAAWVKTGNGAAYRKVIDRFIREYPDDRDGYFYAGLGAEYLEKDCAAALARFEKAYSLTPNYYPITKAIVDCELERGRKPRALAALKRYLDVPMIGAHGRGQAQGRLAELAR